jgi:sterol desaturase/sphingolipid hydroxylase (fatty acid hydroxylase superfamily)
MNYAVWLFGISLASVLVERLWPWRSQPILRGGIASDLVYVVFNSHYLGMLLALASQQLFRVYDPTNRLSLGLVRGLPAWLQLLTVLFLFDFFQWCIHNLLHRVPVLWRFHMVHHSVTEMDWLGDWRFHWGEILVYRTLLYAPSAILGFDLAVLFWYGIISTIVGHYAHANTRLGIGFLKYVINTPQMHIWHHTHPQCGPINRNFGITLSVWDWIFRTAFMPPSQQPARLGFEGIESYPKELPGQWMAPFRR